MGFLFSSPERKPAYSLMVGLKNGGKTTILHKLNLNTPHIGSNVETTKHGPFYLAVWAVSSGQPLPLDYFPTAPGIIFVVDSSDRDCIPEARGELHRILNSDKLQRDSPLLVLANKQDLPHAMKEDEIADKLGLHELGERLYCVQRASATNMVGLREGFNQLTRLFAKTRNRKPFDLPPE